MKKSKIIFIIEDDNENDNENDKKLNSYYLKNKDIIKCKYIKNAEQLITYQKEYNKNNHEEYLEYQKKYYEKRKHKILESKKEKVLCECGKIVTLGHMGKHKKTKLHFKNLEKKT